MIPISDILFKEKLKTIEKYKKHVKSSGIKLPSNSKGKRKYFIDWYIKNNTCNIETCITDLSNYYLYISKRTVEDIIFKNEKES